MQIYANTFLEGEKWDRNWFRQDGKFRDKQRLVWNKLTTNSSCFLKEWPAMYGGWTEYVNVVLWTKELSLCHKF